MDISNLKTRPLYVLSVAEAACKYTNQSVIFGTEQSPIEIFESLDQAVARMPESYQGPDEKAPVILKFEIPQHLKDLVQFSAQDLAQIYAKGHRTLRFLERNIHNPSTEGMAVKDYKTTVEQRVTFKVYREANKDISKKLEWTEQLARFYEKAVDLNENLLHHTDIMGVPDQEILQLLGIDFDKILGHKNGGPSVKMDDDKATYIRTEYGFTYPEARLLVRTRGTVNDLGTKLAKSGIGNTGGLIDWAGKASMHTTYQALLQHCLRSELIASHGRVRGG